MTPRILTIIGIVIGLTSCGKSYRLTKDDLAFNPYSVGDTLFFESNKNEKDTIVIVSVDKQKLSEKCYSFLSCIPTFLIGTTWESYNVNSTSPNNHGEALNEVLTIRSEPDGHRTIMFNLLIKNAWWYGNNDLENNAKNVLNLPTNKFDRGSRTYNDVIIIPSSNKQYRDRDDFIEKIYWSKSKGYVGFDKLNGDKWTIVKQ